MLQGGGSKFAILLGGVVRPTPRLLAQLAGARVIAADSGMAHAATLGLQPELWLGDFDSSSEALLAAHGHVPRDSFPAAKDATDGELAVQAALSRGANEIVLVGAFGGQFDHALAHATLLLKLAERNMKAFASSGDEEAWPLITSLSLWQIPAGTRLSVVGLSALDGLDIQGVRWPLQDRTVPLGSSLTLSNETQGDVSLRLRAGRAVVMLYPNTAP
jgi:thiamine pyrophosphokinase